MIGSQLRIVPLHRLGCLGLRIQIDPLAYSQDSRVFPSVTLFWRDKVDGATVKLLMIVPIHKPVNPAPCCLQTDERLFRVFRSGISVCETRILNKDYHYSLTGD